MKSPRWRLVGVAALLAVAIGCPKPAPPPSAKDTLVRYLDGDPSTLDPITTTEDFGMRVVDMLFRPLVAIDRDRHFVPGLALSWTVSTDGRIYTFTLDPKARWEDGTAVTSEDVKFTLERILDPQARAANWRAAIEDMERAEAPDAATARVTFRKPYAERLFAFNMPIVCAAAYRRAPQAVNRSPVGSGPYRLESWETNQKLTLARRSDVSDGAAAFRRLVFRVIPNPSVRFQAGSLGELDEFPVTRDQRIAAEKTPDFLAQHRILKVPQLLEVFVLWNCRSPILGDARVRQALAMAWSRVEAGKRLYPPDGASLVSGPYPAGFPENATGIDPPPYDPKGAGRLLDAAGLTPGPDGVRRRGGKKVTVEVLFPAGYPMYKNIAEILRAAYAKVGVELVERQLDWAAYTQHGDRGEFDAQLAARQFVPPNLDPYPYFHSSQFPPGGGNTGFYANPEADRVMEAAQRELDEGKRLVLYREVHRLLAADPPADFLWSADQYWAVSRSVEGVVVSPLGLFHFLPGPFGWRPATAVR
jgi:peptide/nickel transport system substrate-binding protein